MDSGEGKELPLFSPINLVVALAAAVLLVGIYLWQGGLIFSPGQLSAVPGAGLATSTFSTHADFEQQCSLCHRPFQASQAELCGQCHQDVAQQVATGDGLHGHLANVTTCRACHPEHRGRDFNQVDFALTRFDHSVTRFALTGLHAAVQCADCHASGYANTSTECSSCHAEPAVHAGLFPLDCTQCHTSDGWETATWQGQPFDHAKTGFSLALHAKDFTGQPLTCQGCHPALISSAAQVTCVDCHASQDAAFMNDHAQTFGNDCTGCHDGSDRMANFDHAAVFPLEGRHADLQCLDCHTAQNFSAAQAACASCHQEPEIHAGFFGTNCQECHSTTAWQPARLVEHAFPLDHGGQADTTCATCHTGAYTEYTCYGCHEHNNEAELRQEHAEENIAADRFPDCIACHLDGRKPEDD